MAFFTEGRKEDPKAMFPATAVAAVAIPVVLIKDLRLIELFSIGLKFWFR
jgi:hypothetical protein